MFPLNQGSLFPLHEGSAASSWGTESLSEGFSQALLLPSALRKPSTPDGGQH